MPPLAERNAAVPYHAHHITERYSLLTLIVIGEVVLAAVQSCRGRWPATAKACPPT